ncbi:uncharacterized protein DUF2059 [Palleronia aestuarii]|uniref:Uncharacterized protein DUF2059 n=1 Tax=Palleronia aestuarii TaxID=568105 RepID=A0A2W7NHH1_9RHOB|nr:DUF2059 domain-containing protein [Palleronia aestuarii]PZX19875.1 uncharacterized protein DUF2059 [Palleronia aestuarii]
MLRLSFAAVAATASFAMPVASQDAVEDLYDALRLDDVIAVMREEGLDYARDLETELFPGQGGRAWASVVEEIYGRAVMQDGISATFAAELDGAHVEPLLAFFASERGRRIVTLEIEARRALRNEALETAAEARAREMRAEGDPRIDRLDAFVDANDLVEENVVGALNSNYAFYQGLIDGGALGDAPAQDEIVADVWSQEPEIRADTIDWVYGYLALAYEPLDDDDLDIYIALSETPEGEALNDALFAAFDTMYADISRQLGQRAAGFMIGEDL